MEHTSLEREPPPRGDLAALNIETSTRRLDPDRPGLVRFIDAADSEEAPAEGSLDVRVGRISSRARGRLGDLIDDAIEHELHARHAAPPGIGSSRDADATLSDQLFRARQVGAPRMVVTLPKLEPLASLGNALGAEDSETLLFWARATRERPVDLRLAASDSALAAHVDPIPLQLALDRSQPAASRPSPPVESATTPLPLQPSDLPVTPSEEPPTPVAQHDLTQAPEVDHWRSATLALTAARGPQPLATLERLFSQSYLPLDTALHDPSLTADPRAIHARDDFRATFSRVYLEAFHAFAVTGKRPKMVMDAPETAARIARQMSARTSQLLLVDGLRYDLGALVRDELTLALQHKATLTHEMILWSALPTTTTHQLETLVHGVAALKGQPEEEREDGAIRGRTAQTIRRVKIGSRDVYKLDLCDARVREAGDRVLPLLPSIAADVAATIAKHALTLAPRTLLFVFGDHGFTLGRDGAPESGGASPEEVLVPAFAFLTGEAH